MAVSDLERTTKFYTALGFKPNNQHKSNELTSFLVGEDEFIIHFFIEKNIKEALKGELADLTKGNEIIFTISADTRQEIDECAKTIEAAGGSLVSQPEEFGQGYYGFTFADPDGHRFNVFLW